jgi:hypothetical protein
MNYLIRPTFLPRLRNEPYVELNRDFRDAAIARGLGSIGITDIMNTRYDPAYNLVVSRLDSLRGSEFTPEIRAQDHVRDSSLRGFILTVQGLTLHVDPAIRAAALKVKSILDSYGNIHDRPYNDQSAAIDDLARELRLPDHLALLTLLKIVAWLESIEEANALFVRLMQARYSEMGQRPRVEMKAARAALDIVLNDVLARVEAQITLYGLTSTSSNYKPFVDDWNGIATYYRNTLATEHGRRASSKNEEEGEGEEL